MSENSALYSYEKCMIYFYVFVSELGSWWNEDSCCLIRVIHFWLEDVIKQVTKWFVDWCDYTDCHDFWIHCICDVMVVALPLTYVGDRVIEPMSNQTKTIKLVFVISPSRASHSLVGWGLLCLTPLQNNISAIS